MSPEQLMGDKILDGRSDTYSLGCVLFEMLTGRPPFAGKEGFVKRFTEDPPKPSTLRSDLPRWMDDAVTTALARTPSERFPTAQEFATALTRSALPLSTMSVRGGVFAPARPLIATTGVNANVDETFFQPITAREDAVARFRSSVDGASRWQWLAAVRAHPKTVAAAGIGVAAALFALSSIARPAIRSPRFGGVALDTARFAVLPFFGTGHSGARFSSDLYDEFSVWHGLPLVSDTRVAQTIKDRGIPTTESEALAIGKALGAGKVVWGEVTGSVGNLRARVHLYDASSDETIDDFVFAGSDSGPGAYRPVAMRLLGGADRAAGAAGCDRGTRVFSAWSACNRGHSALRVWNVGESEREFRAAVTSDPDYAAAQVWLAQLIAWRQPAERREWQDQAARASVTGDKLSGRDRILASALVALGNQDYPDACSRYRSHTIADSADFVGWYGLGECQYLDSLVIPATKSPSGWYFRSSNRGAAAAYQRALKLAPGARAIFRFEKLQSLLPVAATKVRMGQSAGPNRTDFIASPTLGEHDTLAFVPYPLGEFRNKSASASATLSGAIEQDAKELLNFTIAWTRDANDDPAAFEALGDMLEVHGDIGDDASPTGSALTALRRAAVLSTDPNQHLRITSKEAWLHFKRGEFAEAKHLADGLVTARAVPSRQEAEAIIGLASLTGRVRELATLAEITAGAIPASLKDVPPPVRTAASKFFADAALGVCGGEIDAARRDFDDAV
ncbi:MAG TPA: hypothetical protein VEZ51_00480, partial [Gemmatimonadaceae bacterium]|nr:hypothetical protein [Gemmatimonadaceae bacterium]